MVIESTRNETVKRARALAQRKGRLEQGVHFIEGEKLVREAVVSGAQFVDAFIEDGHDLMAAVLSGSGANVYTVRRSVMESLTQTGTPQWVCATVKTPEQPIPEYYPAGLIVALDCVQDPGNLGTILRTADAFGCTGALLLPGCADPYGPKTLRAAMGAVFRLPLYMVGLEALPRLLADAGLPLYGTALRHDTVDVRQRDLRRCALVIGSEGRGVSAEVLALCRETLRIPMSPHCESLNAAAAAAVLLWEAYRAEEGN